MIFFFPYVELQKGLYLDSKKTSCEFFIHLWQGNFWIDKRPERRFCQDKSTPCFTEEMQAKSLLIHPLLVYVNTLYYICTQTNKSYYEYNNTQGFNLNSH